MESKIKKIELYEYLLAFIIMITSGSAILAMDDYIREKEILNVVLMLLLLSFLFFRKLKRKYGNKIGKTMIAAFAVFSVICVAQHTSSIGLTSKFIFFVLLFAFCCVHETDRHLLGYIYRITVYLSWLSLLLFIVIIILGVPFPSVKMPNGYTSYLYVFFSNDAYKESVAGITYYRLQSIFWEPGVYSIYLVLSIYEYTFRGINKKSELIILVTCLLLTTSTTGLILGIIIGIILIIRKIKSLANKLLILIPSGLLGFLAAITIWSAKKNSIASMSYRVRLFDLNQGIKIWLNNFWFGTGYNNNEVFLKLGRGGSSNGLITWCMTMGVFGLAVITVPWIINIIRADKKDRLEHIVLFILFLVFNASEPLTTNPIMIYLLACEYKTLISGVRVHEKRCTKRKEYYFNLS